MLDAERVDGRSSACCAVELPLLTGRLTADVALHFVRVPKVGGLKDVVVLGNRDR